MLVCIVDGIITFLIRPVTDLRYSAKYLLCNLFLTPDKARLDTMPEVQSLKHTVAGVKKNN